MFKKYFRNLFKNNKYFHQFITYIGFIYLKLTYKTCRWHFVWHEPTLADRTRKVNSTLFCLWHQQLAFGMHIFRDFNNMYAIASSHSDGNLLTQIILRMRYNIIAGSSNRNALGVVKAILTKLDQQANIVITPDGPRGPAKQVNSVVNRISQRYHRTLIPIGCAANSFWQINSWDRMILPMPFTKIVVIFGQPMRLSGDREPDNLLLQKTLNRLTDEAKQQLKA